MRFFQKYRWLWLGLFIVSGSFLSPFLPQALQISNAIESWFVEDDPLLRTYQDFQQSFGSDEVITVIIHDTAGVINRNTLLAMQKSISEMRKIEGVEEVYSLANARTFKLSAGRYFTPALPEYLPEAPQLYDSLANFYQSAPLVTGNFVNKEGSSLRLIVQLGLLSDIQHRMNEIVEGVEQALLAHFPERSISMGGSSVIYSGLNKLTQRDFALFLGSGVGLIMLFLFLLYRNFYVVIYSLATFFLVLWLALGIYGALGYSLNLVSSIAPVLLTVVSLLDIIHILNHYKAQGRKDIIPALERVWWPCLFTTLTTVAGFASFLFTPLSILQQLGLLVGIGLSLALLVSFVLAFFFLPLISYEKSNLGIQAENLLLWLFRFSVEKKYAILGFYLIAVVGLGYGVSQMNANTDTLGYFPKEHLVVEDHREILQRWGQYFPIDLMLYPKDSTVVNRPELLIKTAEFARRVTDIEGIASASGFHDLYIQTLPIIYGPLWRSRLKPGLVDRFTSRALERDSSLVRRWLPADEKKGRLILSGDVVSTGELSVMLSQINALSQEVYGSKAKLQPTGYIPLYAGIVGYVVTSQQRSLAIASGLVLVFLLLMLRGKVLLSLAAFLTNLLPVLLILGIMGLAGISLDIATSLIAAVVLGITIDDTIHFVYHYYLDRERLPHRENMEMTIRQVGKAILVTSLLLAGGFGLMIFASAVPVRYFGILIATAVSGALLSFITFLPVLMDVMFGGKP
ncbi:MAG: MMPL family transporter [Bacteroidota bacterium]